MSTKTIDVMQEYIYLLHDLFIIRLNEIKETKVGLGKKYALAVEAQMMAVGDGWKRAAKDKKYLPIYDNISWYNGRLHNTYRELLANNPQPEQSGGSQYSVARETLWKAREMVCFEVARNMGFHPPKAGKPPKLVNGDD